MTGRHASSGSHLADTWKTAVITQLYHEDRKEKLYIDEAIANDN